VRRLEIFEFNNFYCKLVVVLQRYSFVDFGAISAAYLFFRVKLVISNDFLSLLEKEVLFSRNQLLID
jgi:hypothetical protein